MEYERSGTRWDGMECIGENGGSNVDNGTEWIVAEWEREDWNGTDGRVAQWGRLQP